MYVVPSEKWSTRRRTPLISRFLKTKKCANLAETPNVFFLKFLWKDLINKGRKKLRKTPRFKPLIRCYISNLLLQYFSNIRALFISGNFFCFCFFFWIIFWNKILQYCSHYWGGDSTSFTPVLGNKYNMSIFNSSKR